MRTNETDTMALFVRIPVTPRRFKLHLVNDSEVLYGYAHCRRATIEARAERATP